MNRENGTLQGGAPLLFTSFTSFSQGGGIHAGTLAPALPRINLMPLRDSGERSERTGGFPFASGDYSVHFAVHSCVNETFSFTRGRGVGA